MNSRVVWNTKKEGGWDVYKQLTTINPILENPPLNGNTDDHMNQITKELEKCKYKLFGKVKKKCKNEEPSTTRNLLHRKIELHSEKKYNE